MINAITLTYRSVDMIMIDVLQLDHLKLSSNREPQAQLQQLRSCSCTQADRAAAWPSRTGARFVNKADRLSFPLSTSSSSSSRAAAAVMLTVATTVTAATTGRTPPTRRTPRTTTASGEGNSDNLKSYSYYSDACASEDSDTDNSVVNDPVRELEKRLSLAMRGLIQN